MASKKLGCVALLVSIPGTAQEYASSFIFQLRRRKNPLTHALPAHARVYVICVLPSDKPPKAFRHGRLSRLPLRKVLNFPRIALRTFGFEKQFANVQAKRI